MFQAAFQLGLANVAVIGDFSFHVSSRVDDLVEDVECNRIRQISRDLLWS